MLSYKKISVLLLTLLFGLLNSDTIFSQKFAPQVGFSETDAMHVDSVNFVAWAQTCVVSRGYINVQDTNVIYQGYNKATFGNDSLAVGRADGIMNVVSLGDGGSAILTFNPPICDKDGFDFAVFENAIIAQNESEMAFLELAFVEVSSDGQFFFRFPSVSKTQILIQTGPFDNTDATNIYNLAGKYPANYGTPFDLSDLVEFSENLDLNHITHIKIIDVIGTISEEFASYDSYGNIINDPYPTSFASCGFDLDAVGVIHQNIIFNYNKKILVFPNPANDFITINSDKNIDKIIIFNMFGQQILERNFNNNYFKIDISSYPKGVYNILFFSDKNVSCEKFIIHR